MQENLKELTGLSYYEAVDALVAQMHQRYGDLRDPACSTEIMGIARGGLIPATYAAYQLGCPLNIMYLRSYPKPNTQKEVESYGILPFHTNPLPKRILIVDDILDTGRTFEFVKKYFGENFGVPEQNDLELEYCVVVHRQRPGINPPDLCGASTDREDWVIFPYDKQID